MKHPYENALMLKYFPITGFPNLADEQAQGQLSASLGKFAAKDLPQGIATFPVHNGWEVNSHNIAFVGNTVIFSILLQRRRT